LRVASIYLVDKCANVYNSFLKFNICNQKLYIPIIKKYQVLRNGIDTLIQNNNVTFIKIDNMICRPMKAINRALKKELEEKKRKVYRRKR